MSKRLCCRVCGSTAGPFLPDPAGVPDDARVVCSRRCQDEPAESPIDADVLVLPADPDQPVPYAVATSGWHRPDVETAAIEHLAAVVGPVSARQIVDGLLARGTSQAGTAKDTPTGGGSTLPSAVLDLLSAVRDAADVPLPSIDPADERAWQHLMRRRLVDLHSVLEVVLRPEWVDLLDPAREAADIRRRTAAAPVEYIRYELPAETGGDR